MSDASATRKSLFPSPLIVALLCAIVPFVLQYHYVMNAFYYFGAVYSDAGLFANLVWRNDWLLTPAHVIYEGDPTYLAVHFSPFLMAVNGLSYLIPTTMVEFFSVFTAAIYALLAAAMGYAFMVCAKPKKYWQLLGILVLAIGFSFNGVVMQGIWMPHFEYVIPGCIFLFLLHYKLGNKGWAAFFFILTLLLREDTGFHLTAVLGLLIMLRFYKTRSFAEVKSDAIVMLIAFGYSVFIWLIGNNLRAAYGVEVSVFRQIYTGTPPYAHLSFALLSQRILQIGKEAPYLWTGFLVTIAWAIRRRNPYWMVGFVAYIPWFLLNWTANNPNTGTLYAYYAFPFVLSLGWPFLSILCQYGKYPPAGAIFDAILLQVALVVCGVVVWNIYDNHLDFGPTWWAARWGSYDKRWELTGPDGKEIDIRPYVREIAQEVTTNSNLGTVEEDDGMMSLTMGSVKQNRGLGLLSILYTDSPADTLVYFCPFDPTMDDGVAKRRTQSNLTVHYRSPYAPICLFTNRSPEQLGALARLMALSPIEPPK